MSQRTRGELKAAKRLREMEARRLVDPSEHEWYRVGDDPFRTCVRCRKRAELAPASCLGWSTGSPVRPPEDCL
jgi:hypothetical protein